MVSRLRSFPFWDGKRSRGYVNFPGVVTVLSIPEMFDSSVADCRLTPYLEQWKKDPVAHPFDGHSRSPDVRNVVGTSHLKVGMVGKITRFFFRIF